MNLGPRTGNPSGNRSHLMSPLCMSNSLSTETYAVVRAMNNDCCRLYLPFHRSIHLSIALVYMLRRSSLAWIVFKYEEKLVWVKSSKVDIEWCKCRWMERKQPRSNASHLESRSSVDACIFLLLTSVLLAKGWRGKKRKARPVSLRFRPTSLVLDDIRNIRQLSKRGCLI